MLKNVAINGICYIAWDTVNSVGKTGDSANHTIKLVKDGTVASATNSPSEADATNCPGLYKINLTQAETNFGVVVLHGKSATAGISIIPVQLITEGGNLDASVSSRSTYSGGAVASVTAAVTVGTNNDKTGYALTTAPPTAVQVRTEMDSNSTKLANLDATISSRSTFSGGAVASVTAGVTVTTNNDKSGYSLASAPPTAAAIRSEMDSNSTKLANLDAAISSRSVYAGGAVASVTAAVTVGTNNDKTGYALSSAEHTAVVADVNAAFDATNEELTIMPASPLSLRKMIQFLFQYFGFKRAVSSEQETLFKNNDTTWLAIAPVSDDGTTFTVGKKS